jgi:hypothetical protein
MGKRPLGIRRGDPLAEEHGGASIPGGGSWRAVGSQGTCRAVGSKHVGLGREWSRCVIAETELIKCEIRAGVLRGTGRIAQR